jgi:hypothetical protein
MVTTLLLSLALSLAHAPQGERFTVYLSAPMRDGFADTSKDIQDSIKDISGRIDNMKELQTVDRREIADIVLTVVTRGVGSQAFGERLTYSQYYRGADVTTTQMIANTWWVSTMMEVGTYKKELTGAYTNQSSTSMGAWTECAKQIANNLKSWAVANSEQLRKRRIKN